jgi:hypothetical protein
LCFLDQNGFHSFCFVPEGAWIQLILYALLNKISISSKQVAGLKGA